VSEIDVKPNFLRFPLTKVRGVTTQNLFNDIQQYCVFFMPETKDFPNKVVLEFRSSDNEVRSVGFINKIQLEQLVLDLAYAHLFDLEKRHTNKDISCNDFFKIQIHNLKKNLDVYLRKKLIKE